MSGRHVQIVVIGSGFAGSLIAMIARRIGLSTVLVERGTHPRFVIGESTTPLANLLLEEIASKYDLPGVRPLCKWGSWQEQTPQLACGLKRGFTFYHHELGRPFAPDPDRQRQLLVGASTRDQVADTHWYRPDFDHYLVRQAQSVGVEYLDEVDLTEAIEEPGGMRVSGSRRGQPFRLSGELVIDASGPRGFLHRALGLPERAFAGFPRTQGLFSHFANVARLPACFNPSGCVPPYPPEDAAVHHVFEGGWIWVLKFNNGVTSAGVAATDAVAEALELRNGESSWQKLLTLLPSLGEAFASARSMLPMVYQPRISFLSGAIAGPHWVLLPSAAGVVDPLLSTGFPLTLLGIERLGRLLESNGQSPASEAMASYTRVTELELGITARLTGALYATMGRFKVFKALSLLYFAAASFSESARRLAKAHLAKGFLFCEDPLFAALLLEVCGRASEGLSPEEGSELEQRIHESIKPFDVAGLSDRSRGPWYPADPGDVLRNASKLGASREEITAMFRKCGIA